MAKDVWKEYEANLLTHSAAHYLVTIKNLLEEQGYARVTDTARELNITRGSCSISLKSLKKRGLVVEDENKFLQLSGEGQRLARIVERNDELLESFFRDVLGVDAEQAEIDACKIEHLLSLATAERLAQFLSYFSTNVPHVVAFREGWERYEDSCSQDVAASLASAGGGTTGAAAETGMRKSKRR